MGTPAMSQSSRDRRKVFEERHLNFRRTLSRGTAREPSAKWRSVGTPFESSCSSGPSAMRTQTPIGRPESFPNRHPHHYPPSAEYIAGIHRPLQPDFGVENADGDFRRIASVNPDPPDFLSAADRKSYEFLGETGRPR